MLVNDFASQITEARHRTELYSVGARIAEAKDQKQLNAESIDLLKVMWLKRLKEVPKHCPEHLDPTKYEYRGDAAYCPKCGKWLGRRCDPNKGVDRNHD